MKNSINAFTQKEALKALKDIGVCVGRACVLIALNRSTYHYQSQKRADEALIRNRLKELAAIIDVYFSQGAASLIQ